MDISEILRQRAGSGPKPMAAPRPARDQGAPLERLIPGRWVESRLGRCFVSERAYPLSHRHGDLALGELARASDAPWPERFFRGAPFDLAQAALVDTETTGLGRGAGTYCFLVGIGQIEGERLVVRQFFMPDYGDEPLLLEQFGNALSGSAGLITFNGLGFDAPLLGARYVLNGYDRAPLARQPHLDLLPVARRLWRRMLDSCALTALERDVLNVARREDDVPGYLIPAIYQEYILSGETSGIARVIEHNLVDILSMVSLAVRVAGVLGENAAQAPGRYRDPVALGQLHEDEGHHDEALAAYREGLRSKSLTVRAQAGHRLSMLLKRLDRIEEAAALWRAALAGDALHPFVELAKYLEHTERDYAQARGIVGLALDGLRGGRLRCPSPSTALAELQHRLGRLERRMDSQKPNQALTSSPKSQDRNLGSDVVGVDEGSG